MMQTIFQWSQCGGVPGVGPHIQPEGWMPWCQHVRIPCHAGIPKCRAVSYETNTHTHFISVYYTIIRSHMGQPLLSDTIRQRRLSFFGHLCRALRACIRGPPKGWRRRTGRPRQTWLRTVENDDLRSTLAWRRTARRCAMDRPAWRLLVDVATSSWHAPEREREILHCVPLRTPLFFCYNFSKYGQILMKILL